MKNIIEFLSALVLFGLFINTASSGWFDSNPEVPTSSSGLTMQSIKLGPVKNGMSLEQYNIEQRLLHDNKVDALKYVYIIGPNGQITMNFQIAGKVTSSGKRLTPRTVATFGGEYQQSGMKVTIAGNNYQTNEVIEDDGTYGDSIPYTYMWTTAGNFIQIIPLGTFLEVVADKQLTPTELVFATTGVAN